ncbi:hypothetical protein ACLM5H_20690 [Fredinandcohnia humi]
MKKLSKFLCSGLLVLGLLIASGNTALAHEGDGGGDDCGCGVTILQGAERNKAVASTLKLHKYHQVKKELEAAGYIFSGADQIVVAILPGGVYTAVAVPFVNEQGDIQVAGFTDGVYMGVVPGPIPF